MDIWKSLDGMVEAELTSAEPGAALEAANARGIPLYDVIQVGAIPSRSRNSSMNSRMFFCFSVRVFMIFSPFLWNWSRL